MYYDFYFLMNAYYLHNWIINSLRTRTFLFQVLLNSYIYPQLNQNEPVYGSNLGIINELNGGTIKKFLLVLMTTVAKGHIYY